MKITVLGCGGSTGVPAAGGYWGVCDPQEPKNQRSRASLLVQSPTTSIVVDTSYDLRYQLNRHPLQKLDAVLLTHAHSDHVNGIDDIRLLAYQNNRLIDLYGDQETLNEVDRRWPYLFKDQHGGVYQPFMQKKLIDRNQKFQIGDVAVQSIEQDHMTCASLGYRFGNVAYSVDCVDLNPASLNALKGIDVWLVDAVAYHKETMTTHANLKRVMQWVDMIRPKITYLTVLNTRMDYKTLCDELPPHVRPAYDGLEIDADGNQR